MLFEDIAFTFNALIITSIGFHRRRKVSNIGWGGKV